MAMASPFSEDLYMPLFIFFPDINPTLQSYISSSISGLTFNGRFKKIYSTYHQLRQSLFPAVLKVISELHPRDFITLFSVHIDNGQKV